MTSEDTARSVLGSSAVMAAGTMVSRLSGYVRSALLVAALGTQLHGDVFNIANTVPNMLYILLAGGVFNAVLVPQLVRAMRGADDGGTAYTDRVVTLAGVFLAGVTAVLVLGAPWLMRLFLDGSFFTDPALAAQRESAVDFARFCLPQVFFYGMFVLLGQVLNARGRFGPMMWAPIANNVISVGVLVTYLLVFGPASGSGLCGGFSPEQEWLLGLGSTVGIVAQFLILVPYLRAAGYRFRPRFDLRGSGLGHTLRLGAWTVGFVVVNQVAYTVVVRLASSGTAEGALGACGTAAGDASQGYTVYANAFLLAMVPHSVATVSLATAVLPRLSATAAEGDLRRLASQLGDTLRTALALILPFAFVLPVVALPVANLVWGYGAAKETYADFAGALALFAPGLVLFTVHYLVLRGFYALERTRTVFWVQCVIAASNIALAVLLARTAPADQVAPRLVLAYGGAYLVGALVSYALLRATLGGLGTPVLVRFLVRMLLASGLAALAAWGWVQLLDEVWTADGGKARDLVVATSAGLLDVLLVLLLARAMRIREVTSVVGVLTRRLGR